jgi:hypothetical protein
MSWLRDYHTKDELLDWIFYEARTLASGRLSRSEQGWLLCEDPDGGRSKTYITCLSDIEALPEEGVYRWE